MTEEKSKKSDNTDTPTKAGKAKKRLAWSAIALIALCVVLAVGAAGYTVDHISRTNPNFCGTCHNMTSHVESYLSSNHLDFVHSQAGVGCKDCHSDYSIPEEISSAVSYVTGDYEMPFKKIRVSSDMCLQCHIDNMYQAQNTAHLTRNPHNNHNGEMRCTTCHVSHGEQVDFCSDCHDNGGQMMIEDRVDVYLGNPVE